MTQTVVPGSKLRAREALGVAFLVDNELVTRGLEALLTSLPMVATVSPCKSVTELREALTSSAADVVILSADIWQAAGEVSLLIQQSHVKVLMMLRHADPVDVARRTAADGFVLESEIDARTLDSALTQVVNGGMPIPARLAQLLLAREEAPPGVRLPTLTPRESETLQLLGEGLSNKQIGRRLNISEHGAKRLVTSVCLKLDSPNRTLAVVTALREGLLR